MKKTMVVASIALALLSGCVSTYHGAAKPAAVPLAKSLVVSPNDQRQYQTLTLSNGIEVILVSDPEVEKSAAALSVGVGLLHDPMSQQGMAHYLEHMLFLGTERYPDTQGYKDFMSRNGGTHNAYTWLDITNYMFKVNNQAYDEALDRFSDFFKSPKLYPEYTDKEKNAVNAEWSMRREMDFFGQYKLSRSMMGNHPANRFLIGNNETLGDKPDSNLHEETVAFYNKYYSSNIMKLAMISNLPLPEMAEKARRHFATIKNKQIKTPSVTTQLDFAEIGQKRIHYVPNEDVKTLKLDFTIANNMDEFAFKPNYFVTYLLSNEMQGSPAQVLKRKGWISELTANAVPDLYGNYGSLSVDIQLTDLGMSHREQAVAIVMQYIQLIKEQGVDRKYFKEIKTSLANQFRFLERGDEFDYVSGLADSMQKFPVNHAINAPYFFADFNEQAVTEVLEQLNAQRLRVWYISKSEPQDQQLHFYDGRYKVVDIPEHELVSWQTSINPELALPSINRLLPEQFDIVTQSEQEDSVNKVYQDSTVAVWQKTSEKYNTQPKGRLQIHINSPKTLDSAQVQVAAALWADLYSIEKAKLLTEASVAGMGLRLGVNSGLILTISGFTDKQGALLSQALDGFKVQPSQKQLEQAADRFIRNIQNQSQQFPFYQAFGRYQALVRSGNFDEDVLIDIAGKMTPDAFVKAQNELLNQHTVRIFGYGNYNKAFLADVVEVVKSTLNKPAQHNDYVRAKFLQPQAGKALVWQQDTDTADVAIVDMYVHPTPGYAQKAAALVLKSHLNSHLFNALRTEEQLAYAVGAIAQGIDEYSVLGFYIQTPVLDVQAMQARFDAYRQEYAKVLNELDEGTFNQLKGAALLSLSEAPKNLAEESQPILIDWYRNNLTFDSRAKLIEATKQVTLADLKSYFAQSMLNEDSARLNIQIRGKKFADKPFATLPNEVKVNSMDEFYKKARFE
ncbi:MULTISPECIES: insulinase family protein [unclassified Pseudoalteromonas]|uniref:insulinase family protein n=1 Tax=unclassified Pseudoalteromonas TaxID=194690 RepID=UPI0020980A51|nr:insulinase family protein [Pseudoalteromonas sp. XMcav2-N]MCO7190520.1 insulinase family protein [Pseudoalteromonas sp. XMcav2-N]